MKFHGNLAITACILVVSLVLSLFVLYTPVVPYDPTASGFSAVRAATTIGILAQAPHSVVDRTAHEAVRQYIEGRLTSTVGAANVTEQDYTVEDPDFGTLPIRNLLAKIPGDSDTAILLVAHYDSRGYIGRSAELGQSYGAADDGYGVATLLEIARLYHGQSMKNSIYLLFTDGEEPGLYGAEKAAGESWLAKVGLVVNVEARGNSGAAYMFETGKKNERAIDFYAHAGLPVSYNLATAVYSVMPNSTDFTEFVQARKQGLNFAVLGGLKDYHSPADSFANISQTSLQHYGAQIVPLVEEFVSNAKYSDPAYFTGVQDQVFFTLFAGVFVHYPASTAVAMNLAALALLIGLIVLLALRKSLRLGSYGRQLQRAFVSLIAAAVVGYVVSVATAFLGKVPWKVTYVRMPGTEIPTLLAMLAVVAALGFWMSRKLPKAEDRRAFLLAGVTIDLLLSTLTGFVLSGASFVFFVPAAVGLATVFLAEFLKGPVWRHVLLGQNLLWNLLLLVPSLYSLFIALTVGGLLALLLILMLYAIVMVPSFLLEAQRE